MFDMLVYPDSCPLRFSILVHTNWYAVLKGDLHDDAGSFSPLRFNRNRSA
jgi:hypothetical protein